MDKELFEKLQALSESFDCGDNLLGQPDRERINEAVKTLAKGILAVNEDQGKTTFERVLDKMGVP